MGFFKALFGSQETTQRAVALVDDSVRGIGKWIDEQKFTEQEKAEQYLKATESYIEMLKVVQQESTVRSFTRRVLAWAIMGTFLLLNITAAALYRIDVEYAKFIFDLATKTLLGELTIGVAVFYFGVAAIRSWRQ